MSNRDGCRSRGHEPWEVEPVEEAGRDVGREDVYMLLVVETCPDDVGLDVLNKGFKHS
jgi:hypothetical protein